MATVRGGEKIAGALGKYSGMKPLTLRVGFLKGATYPDGKPVAMIAAFNEYGVPSHNQPPRPFFRNMVRDKKTTWGPEIASNLKATNYDGMATMRRVGEDVRAQLQQSIRDLTSPPLAPSTIKRKGFDKPLIGGGPTGGHMLNSADYEVKET